MQLKVKQNIGQDNVVLTYKSTPTNRHEHLVM